MNLDIYLIESGKTAEYPNIGNNIDYPTLGIMGECGEFCEKLKKEIRQNRIFENGDACKELGDIIWYVACYLREEKQKFISYSLDGDFDKYLFENPPKDNKYKIAIRMTEHFVKFATEFQKADNLKIGLVSWCQLCRLFGFFPNDVAQGNIIKLKDRKDRGVIKGEGDNR